MRLLENMSNEELSLEVARHTAFIHACEALEELYDVTDADVENTREWRAQVIAEQSKRIAAIA
jgi:hypothetical protein